MNVLSAWVCGATSKRAALAGERGARVPPGIGVTVRIHHASAES